MSETPVGVYAAINAVQSALSKEGIGKNRQASGGATYAFRGIDDIYNSLAGLLADHKLCIIPRVVTRNCVERVSASNKALFYVTVESEFDLVALDGSKHTARAIGEAMDSSDKATNKAMSAAYKYMCFQLFCIPTEAMAMDSETANHEVQPTRAEATRAAQEVGERKLELLRARVNPANDPPEIAERLEFIRTLVPGSVEALIKHCEAELAKVMGATEADFYFQEQSGAFSKAHPKKGRTAQHYIDFIKQLWSKVEELRLLKATADSKGETA